MTLAEADRLLHTFWMSMSVSDRLLTVALLHEAERAVLKRLAATEFAEEDRMEVVFFHMHGTTIEESLNYVP